MRKGENGLIEMMGRATLPWKSIYAEQEIVHDYYSATDSPEQIEKCMNCKHTECINCLSDVFKRRKTSLFDSTLFITMIEQNKSKEEICKHFGFGVATYYRKYRQFYKQKGMGV